MMIYVDGTPMLLGDALRRIGVTRADFDRIYIGSGLTPSEAFEVCCDHVGRWPL